MPHPLPRNVGIALVVAFLLTLVLQWRYPLFHGSVIELGIAPAGFTLLALLVTLPVVAWRIRRGKEAETRPQRKLAIAVVVLAVLNAALYAAHADERDWRVEPRVLVFGIDGAGWNVIDPLLARGELPNLQRLIDEGTSGTLLSIEPTYSPIIWNSIGTGVTPERHGILSFYSTQQHLKAKRVWEVLGERGTTVGVFRWWMTWPPRKLDGFIVPGIDARDARVRPEHFAFVNQLRIDEKRQHERSLTDAVGVIDDFLRCGLEFGKALELASELGGSKLSRDAKENHVAKRHAEIELNAAAYGSLLRLRRPEFTAFYDNGVDIISHYYWKYHEPESFPDVTGAEVERYGGFVEWSYRYTDAVLGELLEHVDLETTTVVVLSDHGLQAGSLGVRRLVPKPGPLLADLGLADDYYGITLGPRTFLQSVKGDSADVGNAIVSLAQRLSGLTIEETGAPLFDLTAHEDGRLELGVAEGVEPETQSVRDGDETFALKRWMSEQPRRSGDHSLEGILVVAGPGIRRGAKIEDATVLDVAPTLMHLMDAPVAEDLDGSVLSALFEGDLAARPVETVDSYGEVVPEAIDVEVDPEFMEELRKMGYVDGADPGSD